MSDNRARWANDPHSVAGRTLLAKTCRKCGVLRQGSDFSWKRPGHRMAQCQLCRHRRDKELIKQDERLRVAANKRSTRSRQRANTAMPQPRGGYQWTGPEMEIIERDDLTARQAGLMIGRSIFAVQRRREAIRNEPKLQRVLGAQT